MNKQTPTPTPEQAIEILNAIDKVSLYWKFSRYSANWKEDMKANALDAILKYFHNYDPSRKLFSWCYMVAYNAFIFVIKEKKREQDFLRSVVRSRYDVLTDEERADCFEYMDEVINDHSEHDDIEEETLDNDLSEVDLKLLAIAEEMKQYGATDSRGLHMKKPVNLKISRGQKTTMINQKTKRLDVLKAHHMQSLGGKFGI